MNMETQENENAKIAVEPGIKKITPVIKEKILSLEERRIQEKLEKQRQWSREWKEKNKERISLYNKCWREDGDWKAEMEKNNIVNFNTPSPKRIDHQIDGNGVETKHCCHCLQWRPLERFCIGKTWDGLRADCKDCNTEQRRLKKDYLDEIITCQKCSAKIKRRSGYDHMRNLHSEKIYEWKCEDCEVFFKHKKLYEKHLNTESHCNLVAAREIRTTKMEEIKSIMDIELLKFSCTTCSRSFPTKECLDAHEKHYHKLTIPTCPYCNVSLDTKAQLDKHINSDHKDKSSQCYICEKIFSRADLRVRHIQDVHFGIEITCPHCHRRMQERKFREAHLRDCLVKHSLSPCVGASKWEKMVSHYLKSKGTIYRPQMNFDELKQKKRLLYDFYIESKNLLIEVNGKQHYEMTSYSNAEEIFKRTQEHDALKERYAKQNNINLLVIDTRIHKDYEKISKYMDDSGFFSIQESKTLDIPVNI